MEVILEMVKNQFAEQDRKMERKAREGNDGR